MLKSLELKQDFVDLQNEIKSMVQAEQEVTAELQQQLVDLKAEYEAQKLAEQSAKNNQSMEDDKMDKKLFNEQFKSFLAGQKDAFMDAAKGNNTAAAADGAALVPQELLGLAELNPVEADLRQICTVINASSGSGKIPAINYGQTVALVAFDENNEMTEKKAAFISVPYTMASKGAIIPVSRELIADAQCDVVATVGKLFGNVYMADVNASICAVAEAAATNNAAATVSVAIDLIKQKVIALPGGKKTVVIPKAVWASMAIEKNTVKGFLLAKDANGATVKQLEGAEVVVVDDAAMTAKTILVGDFSTIYHIEAPGIEVASSEEAGFSRNSCLVRCVARYIDKAIFAGALAKITIA